MTRCRVKNRPPVASPPPRPVAAHAARAARGAPRTPPRRRAFAPPRPLGSSRPSARGLFRMAPDADAPPDDAPPPEDGDAEDAEGAEEEEEEEEVLTPRSARRKRLLAKVRVTEYQINYVAEQCELEPGEAERRLRHHGGDVVAVLREHLAREDVDPEDDDAPIEGYEEWLRRSDFDDCLF